jgi:hypothetical protein
MGLPREKLAPASRQPATEPGGQIPKVLYPFRIEIFVFVGAASCRDGAPIAAGCRSYKKTESHQIETSKP